VRAADGLAVEVEDVRIRPPIVVGEADVPGDTHGRIIEIEAGDILVHAIDRMGVERGHLVNPHAFFGQVARQFIDQRPAAAVPDEL